MSNDNSRLLYQSMTPTIRGAFTGMVSRIGIEARIGYTEPVGNSQRVVFYLSDAIHHDIRDDSLELDTWFVWDEERGALAVVGEANETAREAVELLANYTFAPFDCCRGIWMSKSDRKEYASKLSVELGSPNHIDFVVREVAHAVFGEGVPFSSERCFELHKSDGEQRAINDYNLLDFDY